MRTNPNDISPNPAKRWFTWDGAEGRLKYYDKELKQNVSIDLPFEFIVLDRLSLIKGWHDVSQSGIYSNEVRRTTVEPFTVRAFKVKEPLVHGLYSDIKDRVKAEGGKFNINLYIGVPTNSDGTELEIDALTLKGSAMSAWFDFENDKEVKPYLFKRGVVIETFKQGKKGKVSFRVPVMRLCEIDEEMDEEAGRRQEEIRAYLKGYFERVAKYEDTDQPGEGVTWKAPSREEREADDNDQEVPF